MPSLLRIPLLVALLSLLPLSLAAGAGPMRAPVSGGALTIARADDGLFYAVARVNGRPVRFLIDTGSNVVMLTAADARRVGLGPESERLGGSVATAGGTAAMGWARLASVELGGRRLSGVQAGIVRHGLPVSLLGQSMLARFTSITISGDRMRME